MAAKTKGSFGGARFTWDSKLIIDAMGRVQAEALQKTASFIATTAKRSMKKSTKKARHSKPGTPPKSKTGGLKNSIRFAYDETTRTVVIGPIKLNGRSEGAKALESGGSATVKTWSKKRKSFQSKVGQYDPRPFMRPALLKEIQKIPQHLFDARHKFANK